MRLQESLLQSEELQTTHEGTMKYNLLKRLLKSKFTNPTLKVNNTVQDGEYALATRG